MKERLS